MSLVIGNDGSSAATGGGWGATGKIMKFLPFEPCIFEELYKSMPCINEISLTLLASWVHHQYYLYYLLNRLSVTKPQNHHLIIFDFERIW